MVVDQQCLVAFANLGPDDGRRIAFGRDDLHTGAEGCKTARDECSHFDDALAGCCNAGLAQEVFVVLKQPFAVLQKISIKCGCIHVFNPLKF